jgi:hypothetical protein
MNNISGYHLLERKRILHAGSASGAYVRDEMSRRPDRVRHSRISYWRGYYYFSFPAYVAGQLHLRWPFLFY